MLHQVGVSFDLYYDARKHKIKTFQVAWVAGDVNGTVMTDFVPFVICYL